MSAFILDNKHINTLVNYAAANRYNHGEIRVHHGGQWHTLTPEQAGQVLAEQNIRSYNYRYEDENAQTAYFWAWTSEHNPVVILKACACYDYQACETPDYYDSLAHAIVDSIRHTAIADLPEWGNVTGWPIYDDPLPVIAPTGQRTPRKARSTRKASRPVLVILTTDEDMVTAMAAAERGY
jgi:hypothetical protein